MLTLHKIPAHLTCSGNATASCSDDDYGNGQAQCTTNRTAGGNKEPFQSCHWYVHM